MKELIVVEAIHTNGRYSHVEEIGMHKDLILLYDDGTYEMIFRYDLCSMSGRKVINATNFKGKTRTEVIAKLEELYYNDAIRGKFLDVR